MLERVTIGNVAGVLLTALTLRTVYVLIRLNVRRSHTGESRRMPLSSIDRSKPVRTMIVIGSGGHTTEMLRLLSSLELYRYSPRCYVIASTDEHSTAKVHAHEDYYRAEKRNKLIPEKDRADNADQSDADDHRTSTAADDDADRTRPNDHLHDSHPFEYHVMPLFRSREVGQSWTSTVFTFLRAQLTAIPLLWRIRPELIVVNGPGTCVPVCVAAFLQRVVGVGRPTIVYVESICRVKSLSLSAKLLSPIVDVLLVQWPELDGVCRKAQYIGRLV